MTELSPAAQAVYNAVLEICPAPADEIAAAALRAVEEQLSLDPRDKCPLGALFSCCEQLLAIAAELEGQ